MASANWLKLTDKKAGALKVHLQHEERLTHDHSNKHIDKSKTNENFYVGCLDYTDALEKMRARVREVDKVQPPLRIRKDRVVCCMIEIPCPPEILDKRAFFECMYEGLRDFFGKENVHGLMAHFDEVHSYKDWNEKGFIVDRMSLEHCHVLVSAYTQEKGINGKAFETRTRLNALNRKLDGLCAARFGISLNRHTTPRKKSVEELKQNAEELLDETIQEKRSQLFSYMSAIAETEKQRSEQIKLFKDAEYEEKKRLSLLKRNYERLCKKIEQKKKENPEYEKMTEKYKDYLMLRNHIRDLYIILRKKRLLREIEKEVPLIKDILNETHKEIQTIIERVR